MSENFEYKILEGSGENVEDRLNQLAKEWIVKIISMSASVNWVTILITLERNGL